jgi:hypothetical protein
MELLTNLAKQNCHSDQGMSLMKHRYETLCKPMQPESSVSTEAQSTMSLWTQKSTIERSRTSDSIEGISHRLRKMGTTIERVT